MNTHLDARATDLAVMRDLLVGIVPLLLGLAIVAALIGAVWLGKRIRSREPPAPRPEDQPKLPDLRSAGAGESGSR